MNLYFRLLRTIFLSLFAPRIDVLQKSVLNFRAWPFDCDFNFHLTNSRYLSLMDLGRTFYVGQLKLLGKILRKRWGFAVASSEITFVRPIKPLQKFTLTTELITWDEKYQYFYQRFSCKNKITATALVKTALFINSRAVNSQKIIALTGKELTPPPMPDSVKALQQLTLTKRQIHG